MTRQAVGIRLPRREPAGSRSTVRIPHDTSVPTGGGDAEYDPSLPTAVKAVAAHLTIVSVAPDVARLAAERKLQAARKLSTWALVYRAQELLGTRGMVVGDGVR